MKTKNIKTGKMRSLLLAATFGLTAVAYSQKLPLTVGVSATSPSCPSSTDGRIELLVNGGAAPYTCTWANGATGSISENLPQGFYDVMVSDLYTSISITVEVRDPDPVLILGQVNNATSFGNSDGRIDVDLVNLVGGFTFNWSSSNGNYVNNGTLDQQSLTAGTYTLSVTNDNGCVSTNTFTVGQPTPTLNPLNGFTVKGSVGTSAIGVAYPNPSSGEVNFKSSEEITDISIYNLNGLEVSKVNKFNNQFETIHLEAGTYNAMIQLIDGTTTTQTIVVK